MHKFSTMFLSLALVVLGGCKKDPPAGGATAPAAPEKVASCNMQSIQSCREYRGDNLAMGTDMLKKLCDPKFVSGSDFKDVACPTEKVIASCAKPESKDFYYQGYMTSVEDIEKSCTALNGKFTKP